MSVRLTALLAVVALLAGSSGCGGSPADEYCGALKSHERQFNDVINSSRQDALVQGLPLLRTLAGKAPDDLTDEWQTLINAVAGFKAALDKSGLTTEQLAKGEGIDGLDADTKAALAGAANRLASQDVISAASGIEQQARDVCQINIGV